MASSTTARTNDRGGDVQLLRTLPATMSGRTTVTTPGKEKEESRSGGGGGGGEMACCAWSVSECTFTVLHVAIGKNTIPLMLTVGHSLENVQWFECPIEFSQLLEL